MMSKFVEWYRLVNPSPDDSTIEKRSNTVADLIKYIKDSESSTPLNVCAAVVSSGFNKVFDNETEFVKKLITLFRAHQPSFQGDLIMNALEMRGCCAIALGEILTNSSGQYEISEDVIERAAGLFICGIGLLQASNEKHLFKIISAIRDLAFDALDDIAISKRKRDEFDLQSLEKVPVLDPQNLPRYHKALFDALMPILRSMQQQLVADQEELEILWWLYNGLSETYDKPLKELSPGEIVVACGAEIAQKVIVPPMRNTRQMVLKSIPKESKKVRNQGKPLKSFIEELGKPSWSLLIPIDSDTKQLIENYPMLFPLSWVCLMLNKSKGTAVWYAEFEFKTGIKPESLYTPMTLAMQVFDECIAQRIYTKNL